MELTATDYLKALAADMPFGETERLHKVAAYVERIEGALRAYGEHSTSCEFYNGHKCSCGFVESVSEISSTVA